ncbi:DNA-binding response regulator, partial [candidate division KSB1 bacterium]|nr:DNA-binding response regulator [candidate division KSB1 bacterium]
MQKNNKILIIEDDPNISELLEIHLGDLGYQLNQAADGVTGVQKFEEGEYALVI